MSVTERDYAHIIQEQLDLHGRDFAGFTRLVVVFSELTDEHRELMARGLVRLLEDGMLRERPGVLADAIHLAYALRLFDERTARAINSVPLRSEMVVREIDNYRAFRREVSAEEQPVDAVPGVQHAAVA